MPQLNSKIWYGSEESYFALLQAQEQLQALQAQGIEAVKAAVVAAGGGRGDDPFGLPSLWQSHGDVAVLNIEGSLISGTAGFMRIFGALGYGDIQEALGEIAADKNTKAVLLNIDSGGGHVDGVEDAGDAIRALDSSKPVLSYTGGTMGSAAYWLGSSARSIAAARTAQVGSVGTLIVHMERSKQLADAGVKPTVVRYGKYKALANSVEPLSEEGKKELQSLADEAGSLFVEYVSGRRGMSAEKFQATAGEGRVFMGRQAKEVGLVDHVSNLTAAVNLAKSLDKTQAQQHNPRNSAKGLKMKLSTKTVLALASGIALDKLGLSEPEANLEGVKLEGAALVAAEDEAKAIAAAISASAAVAVEAAVKSLGEQAVALTAQVADLTTKLAVSEAAKATFETASAGFQAKLGESATLAASMAPILKSSMSVMSVALGGTTDVGASLTGTELVAEHEKLGEKFKLKFPAGGVSAVQGVALAPTADSRGPSPMFMSLVQSLAPAK